MAKTKTSKNKLSPREEYNEALADLNRYSDNNETRDAVKARRRFEKAARRVRWWHR
ncbi:hypothetical protein EV644_10381 [Kribbella orskensis]|uniref:Uncharacterized protein n=1 Tax=Kribbella orskensis TaxID=2512216 RepID=A0ABY2BP53_9ACTN|nr:hypothetical protein EV642_106339 [Kribbella sp. VKM Ac-2500]TCO27384.1 hypothetical protein EV644_10381 [Kribbella orskensis]